MNSHGSSSASVRHPEIQTDITAVLRCLIEPGAVFEIRIPEAPNTYGTLSGYFNDFEAAAQAAAAWSGKCGAVYITPNPVNPALLARAANRLKKLGKKDSATADPDISARRWLLVDLDPVRPSGISSSDAEHDAALVKAEHLREWLHSQGWPDPIVADSGNGGHLLYRVDLPNNADSKTLIESCLKALAAKFDDRNGQACPIHVDTGVFNAARVWKLYGTVAAKGDHIPDRPHRRARILEAPNLPDVVTVDQLRTLAALAPQPGSETQTERPAAAPGAGGDFFKTVNAQALSRLSDWVPVLFPDARPYRNGYRVTSKALNRDLEEDLGIQPDGIVDFGVHDLGDPRQGRRTPIDLGIEVKGGDAKDAALWLCNQLRIDPATLGWKEQRTKKNAGAGEQRNAKAEPSRSRRERQPVEAERSVTIRCIPGELPEMVDKAESALCKFEANFYQRGGQLVRWCVSHAETVRGITRPGGAVIILNQDADYLMDRLNRLISWERWNEEKGDYIPCNAPRYVATTLLARRGLWRAQPLVAAINAPTLRPDGSILDQPGYDAATGLLFVNTAVDFPPIPQQPTYEDAQAALAFLYKEVLSGFPFAAPHDRSAALSAILTACNRHSLHSAPMHTYNAPVMASGKSLLADVVALTATGHPATVMSYTPDGDEMRKRVLSVLMQGDRVVNIDNVEEPLASQTLCTVLTQESFTDRILGVNKTGTAPTLCCWLATGNNLVVAGDLTTRIVPCNLDPQVERPEEREFSRNLYDWIPANRPALVQAVLTVLRAYIVAGKPKQPIKNFARFEDWSGLVRSALVWLGEADPLTGREQLEDGDPVRVKLRALLLAWFAVFRTAPATSKEAVSRANETKLDDEGREQPAYPALKECLEEHFSDKGGKVSSNAIGYFLRKYAGRILAGARFEAYGGNAARSAWRVVVLNESQFKAEKGKFTDPGKHPNNPNHPNPKPHPNPPENAGNPHSTVDPSPAEGWDGCHSWDIPPNPQKTPEEISVAAVDPSLPADALSSHHPAPFPAQPAFPPVAADPVASPRPALSADADALAAVLKLYRGWATPDELAKKSGLGGTTRVMVAAQELATAGLALVERGMVKPAGVEARI